ncbi:fimbrial biogenesis chaperone [Enterobacter hormaechei]|uniref:fimbrial biogenesis chaperone n=1 Tax=Enterobacter hormaechei TaxID=158836 RepID=UPI0015E540AA|nr:fimbria/pilus periplasmic chaperone [Enterobacter hormaechei]QLN57745.1 fimbria/pilus periplasmic chaperone [Enterobacter hormaechei]
MKFKIFCTFISLCFFSHLTVAAVSLSGTRVIYPQGKKEISLEIKNHGPQPVLTQNWIDDGNIHASPDILNIPFVITPPIARIKEVAIKWSAAPDMTPQTVLYRRPVAQFSNFQPKIVSSWLILALFQANFLISGRSRLCPYQLVNSNQVRQGE